MFIYNRIRQSIIVTILFICWNCWHNWDKITGNPVISKEIVLAIGFAWFVCWLSVGVFHFLMLAFTQLTGLYKKIVIVRYEKENSSEIYRVYVISYLGAYWFISDSTNIQVPNDADTIFERLSDATEAAKSWKDYYSSKKLVRTTVVAKIGRKDD